MKAIRLLAVTLWAVLHAAILLPSPVRGHGRTAQPIRDDILQPEISRNVIGGSGQLAGWADFYGDIGNPPAGADYTAIAAGGVCGLALKTDGSISGWGVNFLGLATPPVGNNYAAIAAGGLYNLALRSDGGLVGWGDNSLGQATPPAGNDYVAIAAGYAHGLALKSDGSIVGWGDNAYGQATPPAGNDYTAIAAGYEHSLALKSDGSIVGWGRDFEGQATPPAGNDYHAIAAGGYHSLALRSDGSIVGWGHDNHGEATAPAGNDYVTIAAGSHHSLAVKSDGSIVGWGSISSPPPGSNYLAISSRDVYSVALFGYTIFAESFAVGCTVSPRRQAVPVGGSAQVTMIPDAGYQVAAIVDNGVYQPVANPYVVNNAHEDHLVTVSFAPAGGPTISRVKSKTSKPGSSATIHGSGFATDAKKDLIYFGKKKATVKKATTGKLTVTIPKVKKGQVEVYVMVNGSKSNTVQFQVK
ncbi:MAG: IPT/TIG domain-containing protein [Acidobacteriota bacterium]